MAKRMVTIVDPRRMKMSPGYQYTEGDYIAVPAIVTYGTWSVAQLVNFNVGINADPRNVETVLAVSEKAQTAVDSRSAYEKRSTAR